MSAIHQAFVFNKPIMEAVEFSFGGAADSLNHIGVVVLDHDLKEEGQVLCREFIYSPVKTRTWGLLLPQCDKCSRKHQGNGMQFLPMVKQNEVIKVKLLCSLCGLQTKGALQRPDFVANSWFNYLSFHYILPFPTPQWLRAKDVAWVERAWEEKVGDEMDVDNE
jgi:hypothetical protein